MEDVINIVSTLGFPIFIAVAVFYFATKFIESQMKQYAEREEKLISAYKSNEDRYTTQLDKFSEILQDFNITLTRIDTRLQQLEKAISKEEA